MAHRVTSSMYSFTTSFLHRFYGNNGGSGRMLVNGKPVCSFVVNRDDVLVSYTVTNKDGTKTEVDKLIEVEWTRPNYGGRRRWFRCPICRRRCNVLYMGLGIACRTCWHMIYPSQASRSERGWSRYYRILDRLGGVNEPKPKWMRWATFERLQEQANLCVMKQLTPLLSRLGKHG